MTESNHPADPAVPQPPERAIWSSGFRPFFLAGAVWAVLAMALTLAARLGGLPPATAGRIGLWHGHEMLFGFASAILAGFLLTAIPNWTGSTPITGRRLIALVGLWLLGRIALGADLLGLSVGAMGMAPEAGFLPALAVIFAREIARRRKWKDLKLLAGLLAISLGHLGFHLAQALAGDPQLWLRAAVAGYVMLVIIIAGRMIPGFTRNWMMQQGRGPLPAAYDRLDTAALGLAASSLAAWVFWPDRALIAPLALLAAGLHLVRLARWQGLRLRADWLLVALHLAYAFVPPGFAAMALAAGGGLAPDATLHVLTVGVMALMMLAVMSRAARGYTGRALVASRGTVLSGLSLLAAALLRIWGGAGGSLALIVLSGALWIAGFLLFIAGHAPMLTGPSRGPEPVPGTRNRLTGPVQNASGSIRSGVQGGSHVSVTSAEVTPGTARSAV